MAADFTISQSGGAGAGTLNTELLQVWGGLAVQLVAEPAAAYSWQVLDRPNGTSATPAAPTSGSTTITPEQTAGRWRIELTTPGGSRVVVFEVTKNVSGVALDNGLGVTPAHLERPREAGGRGAARVFERFRASLLSLISALPLADKLLIRDNTGQAVASGFTGGSTLDTVITAVNTSPTERKILIGRASAGRLRFEETNTIYVDRWNGAAYEAAGGISAITGGLYIVDADGTCEFILGPDNVSLGAGAGTLGLTCSGLMTLAANGGVDINVGGVVCRHTVSGGVFDIYANAPMRVQPSAAGLVGAGRTLTVGGSAGQTPGTHLAGSTRVLVGVAVAGETARFGVDSSLGALFEIYQGSGYNQFRLPGAGGASNCYFGIPSGGLFQVGPHSGAMVGSLYNCPYIECDGQFTSAPNNVAFAAGGITLNAALSHSHVIGPLTANMSGNITFSNVRPGALYHTVEVTQDGTGSRTLLWDSNFKFGPTYTNAPSEAANSVTVWTFWHKSATVWRCVGKETFTE